jgi:hypothetical protein
MRAVAIRDCSTFQVKSIDQDKLISWKIGIMDAQGVHYENVMSNRDLHSMSPSKLVGFLKSTYNEVINIFACESDNVNF